LSEKEGTRREHGNRDSMRQGLCTLEYWAVGADRPFPYRPLVRTPTMHERVSCSFVKEYVSVSCASDVLLVLRGNESVGKARRSLIGRSLGQ
jgi:hypothetical protein